MDSLFYYGLVFLLQFLNLVSPLHIIIDGDYGVPSLDCLHDGGPPCKSLQYVAANLSTTNQSNVTLEIISSYLIINEVIIFSDINGLTLIGQGVNNTTITCNKNISDVSNGSGLVFSNCINIKLAEFSIEKCGCNFKFLQAILIDKSTDAYITKVYIGHSIGRGLILSETIGTINVSYCNFSFNGHLVNLSSRQDKVNETQGGMMLILVPLELTNIKNSYYIIQNCTFFNNTNFKQSKSYVPWKKILTHGGGLHVLLKREVTNNTIILNGCTFKNNAAPFAGGLKLFSQDNCSDNKIEVTDCVFMNNTAITGGGGADVGFGSESQDNSPSNNKITLLRCRFVCNGGLFGGGLAVYTAVFSEHLKIQMNHIDIIETIFHNNIAGGGAGVDINRDKITNKGEIQITIFLFESCHFIENSAGGQAFEKNTSNKSKITQLGTFFTSEVKTTISGDTRFENNYGTALYVSSTSITFANSSHTNFQNNTGEKGGAILLVGRSTLILENDTVLEFACNIASYGGAICILHLETYYFGFTENCFIEIDNNLNKTLIFHNNTATTTIGSDIFMPSLDPCRTECKQKYNLEVDNPQILFTNQCIGDISFTANNTIATSTSKITAKSPIKPWPGVPFKINISQLDEFGTEVGKLFPLSATLLNNVHGIKIDPNYIIVTDNTIKLYGKPKWTATLILQSNVMTNIGIAVEMELAMCSPGFVDTSELECVCSALNIETHYNGIPFCSNNTAILLVSYWAGYIDNNKTFVTGNCNVEMCNFKNKSQLHMGHHRLPQLISELEDNVCGNQRQGILCTQCKTGYIPYYHSPSYKCGKINCQYGILYYILTELLPVTALFLLILLLNLHITSGAVYTFIFYAQMLDALFINCFGAIKMDNKIISAFAAIYRMLYGVANFNVFNINSLSFCIVNNATVMDLFLFKYLTIIYALFLILTTIIILKVNSLYTCIKLCHKCGRRNIRGSVINGLTAFLVLCYFQCINVTYSILIPSGLQGKGDQLLGTVPLFDGTLTYMKGQHLHYAIPAIICFIVIILPPPIILISEPVLVKLSGLISMRRNAFTYCLHRVRMKLKPFLDSFQGCFKDNCRCFAGFFFLYRIVIYLPVLYTESIGRCFTHATIVFVLIVMIHAILQPFHKKWHNYLDIFLLSNILLVNILTTINYYSSLWQRANQTILIGQLILIALPLVYISGYFTYHLCHKFKRQFPCQKLNSVYLRFVKHEDIAGESLPSRLLEEESPLSFNNSYRSVHYYS